MTYSIPKLCDRGGDLSKQWYVYFYFRTESGRKQFRFSEGLNSLKTKKERRVEANGLIEALTLHLSGGWNPATKTVDVPEDFTPPKTIVEAFEDIFSIKSAYLTEASQRTYRNQINLFTRWVKKKKLDRLHVHNFTSSHARAYCDYLLKTRRYCGKTYNGHLTMLRTFFAEMVDRKYMDISPVQGFKSVRQEVGKNTVYSEQEELLFNAVQEEDPWFYIATRFVRYCFLRRTELSRIQVKHINWENKTIVIPSKNSKSRIQDSVTIPRTLEKLIARTGYTALDPETYLFGKHFEPSLNRLKRADDFSDRQRKHNRNLGIKKECTFYSWKHTGAVELYNLTKDPYTVMRQCRHTDIKMTMTYLRSLGCGVNEQVREW